MFVQSYAPYDATQPLGADPAGTAAVIDELGGESDRLGHQEVDLADPLAPQRLVDAASNHFGALDSLVVNHARSQLGGLHELEPSML